MINFLLRDEKGKDTWRGQQCEYEGKDWSHVAPSQVMPAAIRKIYKLDTIIISVLLMWKLRIRPVM